jgi:hypothetical protein
MRLAKRIWVALRETSFGNSIRSEFIVRKKALAS